MGDHLEAHHRHHFHNFDLSRSSSSVHGNQGRDYHYVEIDVHQFSLINTFWEVSFKVVTHSKYSHSTVQCLHVPPVAWRWWKCTWKLDKFMNKFKILICKRAPGGSILQQFDSKLVSEATTAVRGIVGGIGSRWC